jgi:uncharacterized membrane protein YGL010W
MSSNIKSLLTEYGESHKNGTNKLIHWICVPLIFFSIVALIYSIPSGILNAIFGESVWVNWATLSLVFVLIYYFKLSRSLAIGMLIFSIICLLTCQFLESSLSTPLWLIAVIIFLLAWIGQFYGHHIEGKKPSFLKDIQFLLIGPAWLMHFWFEKWGVSY